jgi:peptidoglycan/LPS O-acetylase OafA/YrhL
MSVEAPPKPESPSLPEPQPQPGRLQGLDGLRAISALLVVWHHCFFMVWPPMYGKAPEGLAANLASWLAFGHFPVVVFIVISGFCLGLTIAQNRWRGWKDFYKRRARRILPPYYASVALSLLLIAVLIGQDTGTHWDGSVPVKYGEIWKHLLLVNNIFSAHEINGVYWSIAVEWQIYLLFPFLAWLWLKWGPYTSAAAAIVIAYMISAKTHRTPFHWTSAHLLASFALGFLAAHLHQNFKIKKSVLAGAGLLTAGAVIYYCSITPIAEVSRHFPVLDIPVGIAAACLLLLAVQPGTTPNRLLEISALRNTGAFSYSLYLVHMPLLQVVWLTTILPLGLTEVSAFVAMFLIGTTVSLAVAYAFYLAVERRFQSKATGVKL